MTVAKSIEKLWAFKQADKYVVFREVMEEISFTPDDQKKAITEILDNCCNELIRLLEAEKKVLKTTLKKVIISHMDIISSSRVDNANKDFAYELCWYLSEIVGLQFKTSSESRTWGFWKITDEGVKTVNKKKLKKNNKPVGDTLTTNVE